MGHPVTQNLPYDLDDLVQPCYYVNSKQGIIRIYRLFGNDWQSMEEWLNQNGAVATDGVYVNADLGFLGSIKVATRWTVTPELVTMFILRWA